MIITAIREALPATNPTDVGALKKSLIGMTAENAITALLGWKDKCTDTYVQSVTGLTIAEIQAAANALATAATPTVTVS